MSMSAALANLVAACRVYLALALVGWAERLLPLHYSATTYALDDLVNAIREDVNADQEEHRK